MFFLLYSAREYVEHTCVSSILIESSYVLGKLNTETLIKSLRFSGFAKRKISLSGRWTGVVGFLGKKKKNVYKKKEKKKKRKIRGKKGKEEEVPDCRYRTAERA